MQRRAFLQSGALFCLAACAGGRPARAADDFTQDVRLTLDDPKLDRKKPVRGAEKTVEAVLKKRLPILGSKEGTVEVRSLDDIRIRVAGLRFDEIQLRMLVLPGHLEIVALDDIQTSFNPHGRYLLDVRTTQSGVEDRIVTRFRDRETNRILEPAAFLSRCPVVVSEEEIVPDSPRVIRDGILMAVRVQFNREGTRRLERLQGRPGRMVAIVLDGQMLGMNGVAPKVRPSRKAAHDTPAAREETTQMDIAGGFNTDQEAGYLAVVLNAGALPVPLKVLSAKIVAD